MADDDSWLYGEDGEGEEEEAPGGDQEQAVDAEQEQNEVEMDAGGAAPVEGALDANASGSEDSDDDGIQVTIDKDKIEAAKTTYQTMQLKKNNVIDLGFVPSHKEKKGKFAVEVRERNIDKKMLK